MYRTVCAAALLGGLLYAQAANAVTPASPEQILCSNDVALAGTVIDARSHDCRLKQPSCYDYYVGVTVRVNEIFSPNAGSIKIGDEIRASFHVVNGKPMKVGDSILPTNTRETGDIAFPSTGLAVTTADARAQLLARSLVLALTSTAVIQRRVDARFAAALGEPSYAAAYDMADHDWVAATWSDASCKRWKR